MTENTSAKKLQVYSNSMDRISQLPDEILISMLSLLQTKEAGRSSMLSRRWRDLWKLTARLDLDGQEKILESFDFSSRRSRRSRSTRYVNWVNEALKLHQCPFIEEFRVKFDLDISANNDLGNWIKFMGPKRVKVLEINLSILGYNWDSKSCTLSQECYHYFRSYNYLRSISLHSISIDGKLLQYFLSGCSQLETLKISFARRPINFKVKVTSPSLRHLEIFRCDLTSGIELSAPKLVTFKYFGAETEFRIGNNPCLTNLSLGGRYDEKVMDALITFSEQLPQLETLQFNLLLEGFPEKCMEVPQVPELKNLKHLVLEVGVSSDTSLIGIAAIIAAAPVLDKFTLQISCSDPFFERPKDFPSGLIHQSLRVVELLGFIGFYSDLELASYLLNNAINLERIVIDPYRLCHGDDASSSSGGIEMETENIRKRASEALKDMLPPKANLVIL